MKKLAINKFLAVGVFSAMLFLGAARPVSASNLAIFDDSFSLFNGSTQVTGIALSAVWGTWSGTAFIPNQNIYADGGFGYADLAGPELNVIINRVDQTQYVAGTQMSLAIFNKPDLSNWDATVAKVVLTDTSWIAPAWSLVGGDVNLNFTVNTSALLGSYSFNGGNEIITMIPEPNAASLLITAALGILLRKRKSVKREIGSEI